MKAVISGVTGQDGSYLAELLLEKGCTVIGFSRRVSVDTSERIRHILDHPNFTFEEGDICDYAYICNLLIKEKPDHFYNLAAQSHVATSFKQPIITTDINYLGVLNILNAIKDFSPETKLYQASTSEMFGSSYSIVNDSKVQDEKTDFRPQSPYAIAKLAAHHAIRLYRESYGLFACSGILFNHECISSFVPILYKNKEEINIDCVSDFFEKYVTGNSSKVNDDLKIWDQSGWVDIKYASSFKHDIKNDNKGLRFVNSRNSVYSVTNDHVCILEDDTEKPSKELKVGDKVKLTEYPENKELYDIDIEICEMLGMLVGDGHISNKHGQFTNKDNKVRKRFEYLWEKHCGDSSYYPSKSGFTGEEVGRLDLRSVKTIKDYDLYSNLVDVFGHRYKKIPKQILNTSVDGMEAFLVGYNLCDGLKSNPCRYTFKNFKTNSPVLAAGLLFLVSKVTGQKYNITIEESCKHGKQQFYYSINLLSNNKSPTEKYKKIKPLLDQGVPQRKIHRITGVSRSFIKKVKNGYIPNTTHHLEKCSNEIKKIIDIANYDGWFFDLETSSGTFAAGVGQAVIHNSPRRGDKFVTKKIIKWIKAFKEWKTSPINQFSDIRFDKDYIISENERFPKLRLGNLDAIRDWGYAKDYVQAMHLMLDADTPDDFVVATGVANTVRDFLNDAFLYCGIQDWTNFVIIDPEFYRPAEVDFLKGDSTKIREKLNWSPKVDLKQLIEVMFDEEL